MIHSLLENFKNEASSNMNPETLVLKPRRHLSAENKDCQRIDQGRIKDCKVT